MWKVTMMSAALLAAAACGDDGNNKLPDGSNGSDAHPGSDGGSDSGSDTAIATKTITGTGTRHYLSPNGEMDGPNTVTGATVFSYSPISGGGWTGRAGTADGADISFPVDEDAITWMWSIVYSAGAVINTYQSSASAIDLSAYALGRPGAVLPAQDTETTIDATGMTAWETGDQLEFMSEGNGGILFDAESYPLTAPTDGDLAIDQTIDWRSTSMPLVVADGLDVLHLTQVTDGEGGIPYLALTEVAKEFSLSQVDGEPATATLPFGAVARDQSFALQWHGSQFAALQSSVTSLTPGAPYAYTAIDALPDAEDHGFYSSAPDLAIYYGSAADAAGSLDYAEPFFYGKGFWKPFAIYQYDFVLPIPVGTTTATLYAGFYGYADVDSTDVASIAPTLTPPTNVKLNGAAAMSATVITGATTTPTLSWGAPATGTPTAYIVTIMKPQLSGTFGYITSIASFTVSATTTSIQIPADFLTSGSTYVAEVSAVRSSNDFDGAPYLDHLGFARTDAVTGRFTP